MNVTTELRSRSGSLSRVALILIWTATGSFAAELTPTAIESKIDVPQLINQLSSDSFKTRESAQLELMKADATAIELLSHELNRASDPEVIWRLELAIDNLKRPRWFVDVASAMATAQQQNKIVMVFSTIGEINGFS